MCVGACAFRVHRSVFKVGFKVYIPFTAVMALVKLRAAAKAGQPLDIVGGLLNACHSAARSASYISACSVLAHLSQCFLHQQVGGGVLTMARILPLLSHMPWL